MAPEREQEHTHRFQERLCRASQDSGPTRVRFWSQKGEGESKNNETTAAFLREPSEQMIQSRSLPGYQVSSSLTGGGPRRKLGAFDRLLRYGSRRAIRPSGYAPASWISCDRTIRGAF